MKRYKIEARFADEVLCPANAIETAFYQRRKAEDIEFMTLDSHVCNVRFMETWNNTDDYCEDGLEQMCQRMFGKPFSLIKSLWIGRLGLVDNYWHLIKLSKI